MEVFAWHYARLDGDTIVECDAQTYAKAFDDIDARTVAKTRVGNQLVSTVFFGMNHSFDGRVDYWFETRVLGDGALIAQMDRYATIAEARAGHEAMCRHVQEALETANPKGERK